MEDPGSPITSGDVDTYEEDPEHASPSESRRGIFPVRLLWVLSVVPLARESMHGREGAGSVGVFLAVAAISLGVAAVIRGVYVVLRKRRFWSPWAVSDCGPPGDSGLGVQSAGDKEIPIASASTRDSSGEPGLPGDGS